MFINGEWLTDGPTFPVYNPATGEQIGEVPTRGLLPGDGNAFPHVTAHWAHTSSTPSSGTESATESMRTREREAR